MLIAWQFVYICHDMHGLGEPVVPLNMHLHYHSMAFCGMDAATQSQLLVKGNMPGSSQAGGLRVLIFARTPDK